jgi:HEAT repeat protein
MSEGITVPSDRESGSRSESRPILKWARVLLVLAACGVVLVWIWERAKWESDHPALGAVRALRDRNPTGRVAAIQDLESLGSEDAMIVLPALIARLKDDDTEVRAAAAQAVGTVLRWSAGRSASSQTATAAIRALVGLLNDHETSVRITAIDSLERLPWGFQVSVREPLKRQIPPPEATTVLAIDPEAVTSPLAAAVADPDPRVRAAAVRALGFVAMRTAVDSSNAAAGGVRGQATAVGAGVAPPPKSPGTVDPFLPLLFRVLEHDDPRVRETCSFALAAIGPPGVTSASVPTLLKALDSRDREVRYQAVGILARLGPAAQPAVGPLLGILTEPSNTEPLESGKSVQPAVDLPTAVVQALGRIAPSSSSAGTAVSALAELARSNRPDRRASAIRSLAQFDASSQAVDPIVNALTDPDPEVRMASLQALAVLGPKLSTDPPSALRASLGDKRLRNRAAAAAAVASFRRGLDPYIPSLLQALEQTKDLRVRNDFSNPIRAIKPPAITRLAIPALVESLASQDWQVRREAAVLLMALGRDAHDAIPPLVDVAVREGADTLAVGEWWPVSEALAKIAPGTDLAGLAIAGLARVVRAGNPLRRGAAAAALGEFGPAAAAAVPDLIQMLTEFTDRKSPAEWKCAAEALGRIAPGTASADRALHALLAAIRAEPIADRAGALGLLDRFGPSDEVITVLTEVLETQRSRELLTAIATLERLGPPASRAIPKLRELRTHPNAEVRQAANKALAALAAGEHQNP